MIQDIPATRKMGFKYWMLWTLLTALAWGGFMACNALLGPADRLRALWAAGLITGVFQWMVLRRLIHFSRGWVIVTALGTLLPGVFILLGGKMVTTSILMLIGIIVGQWFILRFSVRKASFWFLINLLSIVITIVLSILPLFLVLYEGSGDPVRWLIFGIISGAVMGATTGIGLLLLLRRPVVLEETETRFCVKPTPVNLVCAIVMLVLALAPFIAIIRVYTLQRQVYCDVLKKGLPQPEVMQKLAGILPVSDSGITYISVEKGGASGEITLKPVDFGVSTAEAIKFNLINLDDPVIDLPSLALSYDAANNLDMISSDGRNYNLEFQIAKCPWTLMATWDTLFK